MYRLDKELGDVAPLFFSRIISSFQMKLSVFDDLRIQLNLKIVVK